jgi:beta-fructofuranosidase
MGFRDGGKEAFGGYVMDPVPVKVDAEGLLYIEASDRGK